MSKAAVNHPERLDDAVAAPLEASLMTLVDQSTVQAGAKDQAAPSEKRNDAVHSHGVKAKGWISKLWPSSETLDKLFAYENMGNYVIDRQTGKKIFETMPIYVRVGMHLLFVSGSSLVESSSVEDLLRKQSIKQGELYDKTGDGVREHIQSFIDTYDLPLDELLVKDLSQYPTFNAFFSRRLLPAARPITRPEDPSIIVSPADCRLTVFADMATAERVWVKGKQFSVPELLGNQTDFDALNKDANAMLAIARLAPQDYHRFHSPVQGTIVAVHDIPGELYTVNPQAINEDLNVFTLNKRSVMLIHANLGPGREATPVACVAIGAMLVGSIGWSKKVGDAVGKGEELGWFQYGGSTVITVFPAAEISGISLDKDLSETSERKMETLVRVGEEIASIS